MKENLFYNYEDALWLMHVFERFLHTKIFYKFILWCNFLLQITEKKSSDRLQTDNGNYLPHINISCVSLGNNRVALSITFYEIFTKILQINYQVAMSRNHIAVLITSCIQQRDAFMLRSVAIEHLPPWKILGFVT
jgi:Na+-translocating ferredoxin:NAD+ oxidoreductase RnfA subunit